MRLNNHGDKLHVVSYRQESLLFSPRISPHLESQRALSVLAFIREIRDICAGFLLAFIREIRDVCAFFFTCVWDSHVRS